MVPSGMTSTGRRSNVLERTSGRLMLHSGTDFFGKYRESHSPLSFNQGAKVLWIMYAMSRETLRFREQDLIWIRA